MPKATKEARKALQATLPEMQLAPEPYVGSHVTDNRRTREYRRVVTVGLNVLIRDYAARNELDRDLSYDHQDVRSRFYYMREAVHEAFQGAPWALIGARGTVDDFGGGMTTTHGADHEAGFDYVVSFVVRVYFDASKPSKILDEETCFARLGGRDAVHQHLRRAILRGIEQGNEIAARIERARIANLLLAEYVKRVDERSRSAVRYEQRLAALNAEYKAELEVQAAKLIDELGDGHGVTFSDAPDYVPAPEVTAAAKAKLPERVARLLAPHKRGGFLVSDKDHATVSLEEV